MTKILLQKKIPKNRINFGDKSSYFHCLSDEIHISNFQISLLAGIRAKYKGFVENGTIFLLVIFCPNGFCPNATTLGKKHNEVTMSSIDRSVSCNRK